MLSFYRCVSFFLKLIDAFLDVREREKRCPPPHHYRKIYVCCGSLYSGVDTSNGPLQLLDKMKT
jgi:hypothetical protein